MADAALDTLLLGVLLGLAPGIIIGLVVGWIFLREPQFVRDFFVRTGLAKPKE